VFSDHPSTWMRENASAGIPEISGTIRAMGTPRPTPRMYSSLAAPPDQARYPSWILPETHLSHFSRFHEKRDLGGKPKSL
jgi:hypothetical protein